MGNAIAMYSQDYDNKLVTGGGVCHGFPPGCSRATPRPGQQWQWVIQPYIKNWGVYKCPSDPRDVTAVPVSYGINNVALMDYSNHATGVNENMLNVPAETVALMDCGEVSHVEPWNGGTVDGIRMVGDYTVWNHWDRITHVQPGWNWSDNLPRHNGGANVLYVDGHVKFARLGLCRNSHPTRNLGDGLPYKNIRPFGVTGGPTSWAIAHGGNCLP
jgi:prepilin-type processing-associated H-X9-DG protein